MRISDLLDSVATGGNDSTSKVPSILDLIATGEENPGFGKQVAGTFVQAEHSAGAGIMNSSATRFAMAPREFTAWEFSGGTFDDFMQHLDSMEKRDAEVAGGAPVSPQSTTRLPSMLTFSAGHGGKSPYEMAKIEAQKKSIEMLQGNPLPSDPTKWPVTPRSVAMEGWASRMNVDKATLNATIRKQQDIANMILDSTPEWAKKAASYADAAEHNMAAQAVLDFSKNVPNLAIAVAGKAADVVVPGLGSATSFGFMAAQEEGDFMSSASGLGVPELYASKYAREYGVAAGAIEFSEQAINLAGLSGEKGAKEAGKKLWKVIGKDAIRILKDAGMEGIEEVSQQALQYAMLSKMAKDYARENGKSINLDNSNLPMDKDGNVDWAKAREGLVRSFQAGAGVALLSNVGGKSVKVVKSAKDAVLSEIDRRNTSKLVETKDGLAEWVQKNPETAKSIAENEAPSRAEFDKAGLPRMSKEDRSAFSGRISEILSEATEQPEEAAVGPKTQADASEGQDSAVAARETGSEGQNQEIESPEPVAEPTTAETESGLPEPETPPQGRPAVAEGEESNTPATPEAEREAEQASSPVVPEAGTGAGETKPPSVEDIDGAVNRRKRDDLMLAKGQHHAPGLRLSDQETAGSMAYLVEKGEATIEEWNEWIARAKEENRFVDVDAPVRPPVTAQTTIRPKIGRKGVKKAQDFTLETQTPEQVASERKAASDKAEMAKRANKKMGGDSITAGDMTMDMLDSTAGENALFAQKPKKPVAKKGKKVQNANDEGNRKIDKAVSSGKGSGGPSSSVSEAEAARREKNRKEFKRRNQPADAKLAEFRKEFPLMRRPKADSPLFTELASKEHGLSHRFRNNPDLPQFDVVMQSAVDRGLLSKDASVEDFLALYRGKIKTIGQMEAEANKAEEANVSGHAYDHFKEMIKDGVRPTQSEVEEFPEEWAAAVEDTKVDVETLTDAEAIGDMQEPSGEGDTSFDVDEFERGVGAAAARSKGEFVKGGQVRDGGEVTGLRRSIAEIERKALGYPEEVRDIARRFPEVMEKAWNRISEVQTLIDEVTGNPRPLSSVEVAMLSIAKVQRFNARNEASQETIKNPSDEAVKERYKKASLALEEVFDVAARGGTETGRGLNALKMILDDQFNLVEMEQSVRDKQGGKALSEKQKAELARLKAKYEADKKVMDARIAELEAKVKANEDEIAAAKANADFEDLIRQVMQEPAKPKKFSKALIEKANQWEVAAEKRMRERMTRMSAGVDPTFVFDLAQWGAAKVVKGTVALSEWTSEAVKVWGEKVKPYLRDATKKLLEIIRDEQAKEPAVEKKPRGQGKTKKEVTTDEDAASNLSKRIKEMMREQVEAGVRNLDEALTNVHDALSADIEISIREVRDAFSDYGKARPLNKDEASKVLSDFRRQSQLISSIENVMKKLAPLKSGPQRERPSQVARELHRKLNALMKEAGIRTIDPATQLASSLAAIKTRLNNSIEDLNKAIATRTKLAGNQPATEYDADAKDLKARRDALREQYDAMFPKEPLTDEQRLSIAIKAAERSIENWNARIKKAKSGQFSKEQRKDLPFSERLEELKAQRDAIKAEFERLKELATPKKSPEQIAIDAKKKRLESAKKELERRIKDNDFAPKARQMVDISGDPAAMAAQKALNETKNEFNRLKEEARKSARTPLEVAKESGLAVMDAQRNLLASFDFSAMGRQGWYAVLAHPVLGLKATAKMFQSVNRNRSAKIAQELRERPNYKNGVYQRAKLGLAEEDGTGNFSRVEDRFRLDLVGKVPGIQASNRTYATFLNVIRADMFDQLLANSKDPSDISDAKIKAIAEGVNELTGRGNLGRLNPETMSRFLWAPRFLKSAFDILTVRPLRTGTKESRLIFGKEYLRAASSMALIYAIASMFRDKDDDPIEWDPRSSDFGAIPLNGTNYKFNPIGFVRPLLTFLTRSVSGVSKMGGRYEKLREHGTFAAGDAKENVPMGRGMDQVILRFAQSKAHPFLGSLFSVATGKEFGGKGVTASGAVKDMTIPLALREAYQAFALEDPDAATMLSLLSFMGLDVKPNYQSPEYMRYDKGEDFKDAAGKIILRATGPSADDHDKARAKNLLSGMTDDEAREAFRDVFKAGGGKVRFRTKTGKLTAYGKRVKRLQGLSSDE